MVKCGGFTCLTNEAEWKEWQTEYLSLRNIVEPARERARFTGVPQAYPCLVAGKLRGFANEPTIDCVFVYVRDAQLLLGQAGKLLPEHVPAGQKVPSEQEYWMRSTTANLLTLIKRAISVGLFKSTDHYAQEYHEILGGLDEDLSQLKERLVPTHKNLSNE